MRGKWVDLSDSRYFDPPIFYRKHVINVAGCLKLLIRIRMVRWRNSAIASLIFYYLFLSLPDPFCISSVKIEPDVLIRKRNEISSDGDILFFKESIGPPAI